MGERRKREERKEKRWEKKKKWKREVKENEEKKKKTKKKEKEKEGKEKKMDYWPSDDSPKASAEDTPCADWRFVLWRGTPIGLLVCDVEKNRWMYRKNIQIEKKRKEKKK